MHNSSHSIPCMDVQTHTMITHTPYPWAIASNFSFSNTIPTICIYLIIHWHTLLWIDPLDSSKITFVLAFTSAPFPSNTSTTSLHPFCADMYKGVAPSWGTQHVQKMQTWTRGCLGSKRQTISTSCHFIFIFKTTQARHWPYESITHLHDYLKKHDVSISRTHWCTNASDNANLMSYLAKVMLWTHSLFLDEKFKHAPY